MLVRVRHWVNFVCVLAFYKCVGTEIVQGQMQLQEALLSSVREYKLGFFGPSWVLLGVMNIRPFKGGDKLGEKRFGERDDSLVNKNR